MEITYQDKEAMNVNTDIPDINKCNASDMNEIKKVVNANYEDVGDIADLKTEDMSSVVNAINELVDETDIVFQQTLTSTQNQITVTGLDLFHNNYDVIIEGTGSAKSDIEFTMNNIPSSTYWQAGYYFTGSPTVDTSNISISQGVRIAKNYWYFGIAMRPDPFINYIKIRKIAQNRSGTITQIIYAKWENNCLWSGDYQQASCFGVNPTPITETNNVTELYFKGQSNSTFLAGTKITVKKVT